MFPADFKFGSVVTLTAEHVHDGMVRGFVATGSLNPLVLASLAESQSGLPAGVLLYCAPRPDYNGEDGLLITIIFPDGEPRGFNIDVVVMQAQAEKYDAPVVYTGM